MRFRESVVLEGIARDTSKPKFWGNELVIPVVNPKMDVPDRRTSESRGCH
jgi:hypothetical protein